MKQRIRGLVSLHEIPFSSRALQRKEGNWPHYTKRGREGGVGRGGERRREPAENLFLFFVDVSPRVALHGCRLTCDSTFINTGSIFALCLSLLGGRGVLGGGDKVTLALKPAIVLPPGQSAKQAAQSERERERDRVRKRGRDGCHGYFPGDASTLVYLLAEGARTAGPLTEQMCNCVCLRVRVSVSTCDWMQLNAQTQTPGLIK